MRTPGRKLADKVAGIAQDRRFDIRSGIVVGWVIWHESAKRGKIGSNPHYRRRSGCFQEGGTTRQEICEVHFRKP